MDNLGLRIESSNPGKYATDVSIGSEVTIKFNSELNTRTIPGSVFLLKDKSKSYKENTMVDLLEFYEIVEGSISYKDSTIIFKPVNQLDKLSRYIIYVKRDKISDILGNVMLSDYVATFDTAYVSYDRHCDILEPNNNQSLETLKKVVIEDLGEDSYVLQISKSPTFENVVYEKKVTTNEVEDDFGLGDGLYYVRAKVDNSDFGDSIVFSIKSYVSTATTDQDIDEDFIYAPFQDPELELIEQFPELGSVNVNTKTNVMYMKFNKLIPLSTIDFYEAEIYGKFLDDDDQFNDKSVVEHGDLSGSFTVVYDEKESETYIFFTPDSI